ncbi:right-handed parallel beta-helix repeat-containing protein [Pseudomonadales bacterium]|nr:right-handed parallel beta-helix repeat-containing protein [Pseudomonadales bacterium]
MSAMLRYTSILGLALSLMLGLSSWVSANTISGELAFLGSSDAVTTTYQAGDTLKLQVTDADRNSNAGTAETVTVLVTSDTENTGTVASVSAVTSGSNSGDGTVVVTANGFDTTSETWTLTAASQTSFIVSGSVAGNQRGITLDSASSSATYTSDNGEITLTVTPGSSSFSAGDTFTFTTTAADQVGETITLTETGANTGVFTASVALSDTATPSAGNGTLELVSGDRITAFYSDPAGDFGTAENKRAQAFYAKTVLAGRTLIGDTIWSTSDSPYLVTGDITVDTGVTLVIQAGVQVLFLANSDDQSSGQRLSDSELLVKGTLSVLGTAEAPVVLSSSNAVAAAGDWGGIYLEQNADLTLSYAHLSFSGYGVSSNSGIKDVEITHSRLESSGGGIYLNQGYDQIAMRVITDNVISVGTSGYALDVQSTQNKQQSRPNLSRNTITNPQGSGVRSYYSTQGITIDANTILVKETGLDVYYAGGAVAVTSNVFENIKGSTVCCKGNGINVNNSSATGGPDDVITSITLQSNTIKQFNAGLYFDGSDRTILSSVSSNTITDSEDRGMYVTRVQGTSITGNTVTGSRNGGVYLQNAVPSVFKDNVITGNGTTSNGPAAINQPGLLILHSNAELSESFLIEDNDLSGNGIGIELREFANVVIKGNDLSGSTSYGLNNLTTNAIDARYNYWGLVETTTLDEGGHPKALSFVYDGLDDSQYGTVNYAGWQAVSSFDVPDNDLDGDGTTNELDNCANVSNADQSDIDGDGIGDACDTDADGDGLANTSDAFPLVSIEGYTDTDGDGRPDDCNSACVNAGMTADTDDDNDGVLDTQDAYPLVSLGDLLDTDGDGFPNDCDPTCQTVGMIADSDDDGDALLDGDDNCPLISNADQADADGDGVGDICDGEDNDTDGDGVLNEGDNCRLIANADQRDLDGDDIGDLCDDDDDGDSCPDKQDAFPNDPQRCEAGNQKAIVVAGGGPYAGNYLWPATEAMAEFAIASLVSQGIAREDVHYLSAGFGAAVDPDGEASREAIQAALLEWTQANDPADDVLLYLVDHGGPGVFELDQKEVLKAETLKTWLDTLQDTIPGSVTVVYDACESGSFNPILATDAHQRLVISSAEPGQSALFAEKGNVSFSKSFWSTFFVSGDLYRSYLAGQQSIKFVGKGSQVAQISADGDASTNTKSDRSLARQFSFGRGIQRASDLPEIASVSDTRTLNGESTALLTAFSVSGTTPVTRVWAVVNSPDDIIGPADTPILNVTSFELSDEDGDGDWTGEYDDFGTRGTYEIQFFAENRDGYSSLPTEQNLNRAVVIQTEGRDPIVGRDSDRDGVTDRFDAFPLDPTYSADLDSDLIPDPIDGDADGDGERDDSDGRDRYEPNDEINSASFIALGSGAQVHSFNEVSDIDHVWFYAEQGVGYRLAVFPTQDQQETGPDLRITLLRSDGVAYAKDNVADDNFSGEGERYVFTPEVSGIYIGKIWQSETVELDDRLKGRRTEYEVSLKLESPKYSEGEISLQIEMPNYVAVGAPTPLKLDIFNRGVAAGQYQMRMLMPDGASISGLLPEACSGGSGARVIACSFGTIPAGGGISEWPLELVFAKQLQRTQLAVTVFDGDTGKVLLDANNSDNTKLKYFMVSSDEDGDKIPDDYELRNGLDAGLNDADRDLDGDGITNLDEYLLGTDPIVFEEDQDGDGYFGDGDEFPADPNEWLDTDDDGLGNNGDPDDDGDGYVDGEDALPLDASEYLDSDLDGLGNNADPDDDNDGISDEQEAIDGTNPLNRFSCKTGCFSFDVDQSSEAEPLTDGLLVIRHLFGFSDNALTSGAVDLAGERGSAALIKEYLTGADTELDIDGDGTSQPLTDGLLLIRYLFGFKGDSLISGAIGDGAERGSAEAVEAYIEERMPAL